MPSIRKRGLKRREVATELDKFQRQHLLRGSCVLPWKGYGTHEDYLEAWGIYGEELLAEFIKEHPGQRPAAWWIVRLEIQPSNHPVFSSERDHRNLYHGAWQIIPNEDEQPDYLREHGLLVPGEEERIAQSQEA